MYKILISGYYGFNNIGDESILKAVVSSLRERLGDIPGGIEITVLSSDPAGTSEKYGVRSANRKSIGTLIREVSRCQLLISGGGSLLQDVTSKKSILYYLFIMWLARFMGKDYFVYSQGIGPINSAYNRKLTYKILRGASGIVVRDESSREFLTELGLAPEKVVVTADPVLSLKPAELEPGRKILEAEGLVLPQKDMVAGESSADLPLTVGFAIRQRKLDSELTDEFVASIAELVKNRDCRVVLIPFFFAEDMAIIELLKQRLDEMGLGDKVFALSHKYLTDEMMSIIGNMDILVGVRLHSLIHAAIMGVPVIGISYDPKVNSFMKSLGLKAMCSIYDFTAEDFLEEFDRVAGHRTELKEKMAAHVAALKQKLGTNEEMIRRIIEK